MPYIEPDLVMNALIFIISVIFIASVMHGVITNKWD
jgi:preprotein translocase subunit Sec61beta